jgi:hypothetical protein
MELLLASQIVINKAGYLVSVETNKPVTHTGFVVEQKQAEYVVKLAEAIKEKNFVSSKVDNLDDIKKQVWNDINKEAKKSYVPTPEKPTNDIQDQLTKFALDFVGYEDDKKKAEKINDFMQQFNTIDAIENVGDYFSEGLVKLNKIYSIQEILEAVKIHTEKLN